MSRPVATVPPRGVYAPVVCFFDEDENIDAGALEAHIARLATAGVAGLVVQGSNGEAPHLLHSERIEVTALARRVLDKHGRKDAAIIAGCGAQSTKETILLCREAKDAGADFALVLSPSYWTAAMGKPTIKAFFNDVAEASPIPILLYNFPAVTSGIDLDSDTITSLAIDNPKIVGCKLTCGNVGKLHRIAHDRRLSTPFAAFAGKSDFFLHGLVAGSHGVIAAAANFVPKVHLALLAAYDARDYSKAEELQTKLSVADWVLVQLGVAGLKGALHRYYGYGGGRSRRPLGNVDAARFNGDADTVLRELVDLEQKL
ncbi:hypothetical protein HRR86_007480 [Exophiala dermatitidis]|uniref:Dihydrodipicolinate synthetase n=2 Tax=Exophiala dermatitidis TaxID=5970 RepID=H6BU30_EXODN|nr:dihydrodipicolinate synthetase [Exophiala dermatitidis NIH/UT8656]KAJ4506654.1 hypothetical protein HRR75_006896 [Exophiala dermatitidis]EHY55607.1 dihydrodipicolinate synthetase [Exophiala dermatitidis NIH/UT8656]KAJ4508931.1 hypothetical protein HRR74_007523 [Exophiala dermatitidis]KAJ4510183.1 hypothetical protein HRR73_006981 [Exophiala dermatitidis]KAJ4539190.1 hypothetical protein HRR77_006602 [Exophiala dermatitidis]